MQRKTLRTTAMLVMLAGAGLNAGCGSEVESVAAAGNPVEKPEISISALESPGKPSIPLAISYAFDAEPKVGEPLTISIAVSGEAAENLSMGMSTRGGIALSKNTPQSIPLKANATVESPATYQAVVTPETEGRAYLNLQITGMFEGRPFTKAKTIPVQVGTAGPELASNGSIINNGVEVLSSMPAKQDIKATEEEPEL